MLKSITALAAASSLFLSQAHAQDTEEYLTAAQQRTVDRLIDAALEDDTAYEIVESLTTEIGPRLPGSEAEARARDWAAAKLKELGFKNVRIETFEHPYWSRISEEAAIVSPFPQKMHVTALGFSVPTPDGGVEGEIVSFRTLDDLKAAPLTGYEDKIIFVDEIMMRTQDGSGYGAAVGKRSGAAVEAGKRGAAAALIRSAGTSTHRHPHTGVMRYDEDVPKTPIAALSNADADQLARALERADGPVRVSMSIAVEARPAAVSGNVIGEIPGQTDEVIVVGGHLDSWDLGTGAVDDGAGVAITTAAAKLVGDLRGKPKRTIRVVLWGAEETGLWGARAYAEKYEDQLDKHVLASESDFGAGEIWQFQSRFGDSELEKAKVFSRALRRLGVGPGDNNAFGGPDVGPLRAAGVPVVSLRQNGWDYFDLHHTPDDTLDKIDPADLQQNVAAWAAMIYIASELEGGFRNAETPESDTSSE